MDKNHQYIDNTDITNNDVSYKSKQKEYLKLNSTLTGKSWININNKEKINIDANALKIPELFNEYDVESMKISTDNFATLEKKLNDYFIDLYNKSFDSNMLIATAEYNINNFDFILNNLPYLNNKIIAKILNSLMILLDLREDKKQNSNLSTGQKNMFSMHGAKQNSVIAADHKEIDFSVIGRLKLLEFKSALSKYNLIQNNINNIHTTNNSNNSNYYLKSCEIAKLLNYINTFFFPYIRLYYNFFNIEDVTDNKNIEIVISTPLPVPSLTEAVTQIEEKNQFDKELDLSRSVNSSCDNGDGQSMNNEEECHINNNDKTLINNYNNITTNNPNNIINKSVNVKEDNLLDNLCIKNITDKYNKDTDNKELKEVEQFFDKKLDEVLNEYNHLFSIKKKHIDTKYKEAEDFIKAKKK